LDVLDTAGEEEFTALRDQSIRDGDAFVLAFSISSRHTFSQIRRFLNQIQDVKNEAVPMILVGNKSDLGPDWREVPAQEGTSLAKELGCEFIETSAKDGTNVEEAFRELVRTNRRLEKQQKSQSDLGSIKENLDSRSEPIGRKKSWRNRLSQLLGLSTKPKA
jgi:GTPase KRas protein